MIDAEKHGLKVTYRCAADVDFQITDSVNEGAKHTSPTWTDVVGWFFGVSLSHNTEGMVYLPTFGYFWRVNVGKYNMLL